MSACRNPECLRGLTPGLVIVGKGNKGAPVVGEGARPPTYRWAWVRCLSCNAPEDARKNGAVYKHVNRAPEEIAQRAELANSKAPYKPESEVGKALGGLNRVQTAHQPANQGAASTALQQQLTQTNAQLAKLLEANTKLTENVSKLAQQVSDLLDENRALKKALDAYSQHHVVGSTGTAVVPVT